jgi:hypothetical protein
MNIEIQVVTCKEISIFLKVSLRTASEYAINTRRFYKKKRGGAITLGQVLKANNLEK